MPPAQITIDGHDAAAGVARLGSATTTLDRATFWAPIDEHRPTALVADGVARPAIAKRRATELRSGFERHK